MYIYTRKYMYIIIYIYICSYIYLWYMQREPRYIAPVGCTTAIRVLDSRIRIRERVSESDWERVSGKRASRRQSVGHGEPRRRSPTGPRCPLFFGVSPLCTRARACACEPLLDPAPSPASPLPQAPANRVSPRPVPTHCRAAVSQHCALSTDIVSDIFSPLYHPFCEDFGFSSPLSIQHCKNVALI